MSQSDDQVGEGGSVTNETSLTFEKALTRLEEIVSKLESQDEPLDESVRLYEEGIKLKTFCEQRLEDARMTVERITPPAVAVPSSTNNHAE